MAFYITDMNFIDGRHFVDYWVNEFDAYNYWDAHKEKCDRAECFRMVPDEDNVWYKEQCLGEFDKDGHYYYQICELNADE